MEKQGKMKSVDQNITEPKHQNITGEIEWQAEEWLPVMIQVRGMGGIGKTLLISAVVESICLSSNYKPVTVNDIARSACVTATENMFIEGYAKDELDCKNFASPDLLSVAFNDNHLTGYMQKGSLENHLIKRHSTPLPWITRLKIAVEVEKGLAFLHGAKKPVIYRDFKASNILLDSDYNAKLADFGLGKDGPRGEATHVSARVMGTQGYAAPEYTNTGNMFSQLDNIELRRSYRNVPRDPKFQHDYTYKHSQPIRKDIVQCLSSLVVSIVVSLGIFYNIWSIQLSIFQIQPLHKEHNYRLSIWPSLLGLFGFMVFVCAVAVMNLVGAPFTSVQKAMLIFLAILMHLQSANSIIEVFVTLVGGLSMGWHAFGKKATTK